ncbi:hypothetical protein PIB30_034526 [Stylosanthes scabra]|uniref:Uncharacterized protein n=1 Tax=Stylosanthes scabra TaxID=79078 RepID=A0ABU6QCX5_9FABA|nr:hypothetical protein [Stylosanthes scabra]
MRHVTELVVSDVVAEPDFRGTREYLDWWAMACMNRYLSQDSLLENPRVQALSADIRPTPSQPRPGIPLPLDAPPAGVGKDGEQDAHAELLDRGGLLTERDTMISLRRRDYSTSSSR